MSTIQEARNQSFLGGDRLITLEEAAKLVCSSIRTVRRWIDSGKLRSSKPGGKHLVRVRDLEDLVNRSTPTNHA